MQVTFDSNSIGHDLKWDNFQKELEKLLKKHGIAEMDVYSGTLGFYDTNGNLLGYCYPGEGPGNLPKV